MQPVTNRAWRLRSQAAPDGAARALVADLGIHPLAAALLACRGLDQAAAARSFLDARLLDLPDPFLMHGMAAGAERIGRAIQTGEGLSVHGDYDVDGISGTALLVEGLRSCGAQVRYFIPLRLRDGYGLCGEDLRQAAEQGTRVAITVDCGISAVDEADLARDLGLDLIITDHHQPPHQLPRAFALINPHLPDCPYPFKPLAGVGVAFMLLIAVRQWLREHDFYATQAEPDLRLQLDLVALGTIADLVPLTGVNRILTRTGIRMINQGRRPGLRALCDVAGIRTASCGQIAFGLAPRLNAAGRLEDAALGIDLLLESDPAQARTRAEVLDRLNRERQQLEQQTFAEAVCKLEAGAWSGEAAIVLADATWHPGVIGIVASRLVERYHRPTVLIALDQGKGKGSARSIPGLHLYQLLQQCEHHLLGYGGHAAAAGLSLQNDQLAAFADAFEALTHRTLADEDRLPQIGYDQEVLIEDCSLEAVVDLEQLAPFGMGNPEPVFLLRGVRVQQIASCGEKHLRFSARQGGFSLPCIAFNLASRRSELEGREVDLLGSLQKNEWQGRVSLQLRVKDVRSSE